MLSPHTPPGTKVVCILDVDCDGYLRAGEVYTVKRIDMMRDANPATATYGKVAACVILEEVGCVYVVGVKSLVSGWGLRRFRRAVLPSCLTDLLITEMV